MPRELQLEEQVSLAARTTLGVGGRARWFALAKTSDDIAAARVWCDEHGCDLFVLGGGSNLVISDRGFDGLVLWNRVRGLVFDAAGDGTVLSAGAGEVWDDVVAAAVDRGLGGIECLSGIPGQVGGTPIQNVGAYGQEVSQAIESVAAYDRSTAMVVELGAGDCGFAYRMSRFKGADAGRFVVTSVRFRLRHEVALPTYPDVLAYLREHQVGAPTVADLRRAVLSIRRRKGMVVDAADPDTRSAGSFFMNPLLTRRDGERIASIAGAAPPSFGIDADHMKVPAAWLIERAGFHKGTADGAVGISTKHPLALVNRGGAAAADVLRLAVRIKRGVADRFGVCLRPEPIFVGFGDDPGVQFLLS
jgi:UDP-N-acetylmuramate dehydrogenase